MAAPSFLEGAGGTGLHALEVQDIYDEATVAVHNPEVGYMHARQELKGAEVLWGGHSLVQRVPAASGATAREVDLTSDGCGVVPLALDNRFVDFTYLIDIERLFEQSLAVDCNIRNGPCIKSVEIDKPGRVLREPELNRLARGYIVTKRGGTEGSGEEIASVADGDDVLLSILGMCTCLRSSRADKGLRERKRGGLDD